MLGWKPAVRQVSGVSLQAAKEGLMRQGFQEYDEGRDHVILKRPGTELTSKAHKLALEAALARQGEAVELQLRYDTFVFFDTGDLDDEADRVARVLGNSA